MYLAQTKVKYHTQATSLLEAHTELFQPPNGQHSQIKLKPRQQLLTEHYTQKWTPQVGTTPQTAHETTRKNYMHK